MKSIISTLLLLQLQLQLQLLLGFVGVLTDAFVPPHHYNQPVPHATILTTSRQTTTTTTTTTVTKKNTPLFSQREEETLDQLAESAIQTETNTNTNTNSPTDTNTKKGGLDENVRNKLVTESIAPWRTLRLFLYVSAGSGATLGGIITLAGAIAAAGGARTDVDFNTEYLNLAIDFGAAAFFAVCFKLDSDKQKELTQDVETKIEKKKERKQIIKKMKDREQKLSELSLNIQISEDGTLTTATVGTLQKGAKQHMIIVIGPRKVIRDALVGANLMKNQFSMSNVLVVPYETGGEESKNLERPSGGFGDGPGYENQPYVARVTGEGWTEYMKAEMDDAVAQNGEKCRKEGIAVVLSNTGKVVRRGVGKIPWRIMIEDLTGKEEEEN